MMKVFFVEKKETLEEDEELKRKGFEYVSAKSLGEDREGYFFFIKAEEEFFEKCEALKKALEITGEEREKVLKKFEELNEDVLSGMGLI